MRWEPNEELKTRLLDLVRAKVVKERTGIHLSDLDLCLRKAYFRIKKIAPEPSDQQCLLYISGLAFQSFLLPTEEEVLTVDGINCSPDYIDAEGLIEVKSTRQSSKKFHPEGMVHWTRRILGYMKALGLLEANLVVFFTAGDWSPPFPQLLCWKATTTLTERETNWIGILNRKATLEYALEDGIPPSYDYTETWEGEYCELPLELCPECVGKRKARLKEGLP